MSAVPERFCAHAEPCVCQQYELVCACRSRIADRMCRRFPSSVVDEALDGAFQFILDLLIRRLPLPAGWEQACIQGAWQLARAAARRRRARAQDPAILDLCEGPSAAADGERLAGYVEEALPVLTPMQQEVFRHRCAGLSQREIAALLGIAPATVARHVERIRARLVPHFDWLLE